MPVYHKWQPITGLEDAPENLADGGLRTMLAFWREQKDDIDPELLRDFDEKLRREWAIETGQIEGVYNLTRGITETLIKRGIDEALIPHTPGQPLPEKTAAIIQDHKNVVDGLFDFVGGSRKITTSYIKELHAALVQNQDTATGVDQFGNKIEVHLLKGKYKNRPNNPTRSDGKGTHQYCPPEQTASEMDNLIKMNNDYTAKKIAPEVRAAWLHHRFTQIHPFQDGNGRVARCLATLIFIRAGGFPLTIRDINGERDRYLDALEAADHGDLQPLISIFTTSQRREIIKAISISREVLESTPADADYQSRTEKIIKSAAEKITAREVRHNNKDYAQVVAEKMHGTTMKMLTQMEKMLHQNITAPKKTTTRAQFLVKENTDGDYGNPKSSYYRRIRYIAEVLGYHPTRDSFHKWARLVLNLGVSSNILISFHEVGQTSRRAIACSASFLSLGADDQNALQLEALTDEAFFITNRDTKAAVEKRFRPWLESAIERGLAMWHKSL